MIQLRGVKEVRMMKGGGEEIRKAGERYKTLLKNCTIVKGPFGVKGCGLLR